MGKRILPALLLTAVFCSTWSNNSDAFFPWRHRPAAACTVTDIPLEGVPPGPPGIREYGKDPRVVPNTYPWHVPSMFSGFRHYHMPPMPPMIPINADGLPPSLGSAEEAPPPRRNEAQPK